MSFTQLPDYSRIKEVHSLDELVTTPFRDGVNALYWRRTLEGNYAEVIQALLPLMKPGINTLDEALLKTVPVSEEGKIAIEQMMRDQYELSEYGLDAVLDCVVGKAREIEEPPGLFRRDVASFHVDSANAQADTYLCTYIGASSEGIRNEQARRHIDVPATRAALLKEYGGADDESFAEYLNEHFYDLHYAIEPQAQPFYFGIGNLWRIATEYPDCPVPPCIHRAPETLPGDPSRLLLIG